MVYSQPTELNVALDMLAQFDPQIVAGGTDVYPALQRGPRPEAFLDVTRIAGLRDITRTKTGLRFGAAVTWSDIAKADLPRSFDALRQAAREVGSLQIQNAGTIAGNLCNASPAADGVPPLLALNAEVELTSLSRGRRVVALAGFITGVRRTALLSDELVTAILVPTPPEGMVSGFEKLGSRRYLVISIAMTAANILLGATGHIEQARIAVGSCSAVAQRLPELEQDLIGKRPVEIGITPRHLARLSPIDDVRGSGAYRLEAAVEQIHRAITKAVRI